MFDYRNAGEIIFSLIAIVVSFTIHEYSHAFISTVQGDDTPKTYGRLTLNPAAHIDIMGFICLFLFKFGWAKPVPISSKNYKNPRLGIILTSIAGPFSNLILAFISIIVLTITYPQSEAINYFLMQLIFINVGLAVFNLIPIPPLDGSKIIGEIFGGKVAVFLFNIQRGGIMIIFILLWLPPVSQFISNTIIWIINIMGNLAGMLV
jgi:Zn-dependent protease